MRRRSIRPPGPFSHSSPNGLSSHRTGLARQGPIGCRLSRESSFSSVHLCECAPRATSDEGHAPSWSQLDKRYKDVIHMAENRYKENRLRTFGWFGIKRGESDYSIK